MGGLEFGVFRGLDLGVRGLVFGVFRGSVFHVRGFEVSRFGFAIQDFA